nr:hypothetical protein [Bacteroidota bacterium]
MKQKLKTFSDFAKWLLPLEVEYLLRTEKFEDPVLQDILNKVSVFNKSGKLILNPTIDKRKYSYLKSWISRKLNDIDVDILLVKISDLDKKVMTDSLLPDDEKAIVKIVKTHDFLPFYFMRIYELVQDYRSFLLIRVRHQYTQIISQYLEKYKSAYDHSKNISSKLNEATRDIVNQYAFHKSGSKKWEDFLKDVFYDETMDGLNRYYAIVRLTFLYYNYNQLGQIVSLYDYLDSEIAKGNFYSRRILLNYYSNRVMLHAKLNGMEQAEHFGYLSIRGKGSDYIHYLNNLCSVLLKRKKSKAALSLMQQSIPELKKTMSYHNRVGFASLLIKCLNANNKPAEGQSYASTFFKAYKDKILMHRWHTFFSAYLQSLIMQEKYNEVLSICHRQKIMDQEFDYSQRAAYLPTISWYYQLSLYKVGKIDLTNLDEFISTSEKKFRINPGIGELMEEISQHVPELIK